MDRVTFAFCIVVIAFAFTGGIVVGGAVTPRSESTILLPVPAGPTESECEIRVLKPEAAAMECRMQLQRCVDAQADVTEDDPFTQKSRAEILTTKPTR